MWLQSGKDPSQTWTGGYGAGSASGNANLKSNVQIIDPDGTKYPMLKEGTDYIMGGNPGENINIKLQTSSDGDPRSDQYGVYIKKLDIGYLAKVQEDYLRTLGAARRKYLLEHPDELSQAVMNKVNSNQALVGVYSVTGESDEDGLAEVNIPIQPGWNNSLLFTFVHYGYAAGASDDQAKRNQFWMDVGSVALEIAAWGLATVASGGLAAVAGVVRLASLAKKANRLYLIAEVAFLGKQWFQDGFGIVGLNKYDSKFPNPGGFNHQYIIDTTGATPRTAIDKFLAGPLFYPIVIGALAITVFG
jgi:hypothetical protein